MGCAETKANVVTSPVKIKPPHDNSMISENQWPDTSVKTARTSQNDTLLGINSKRDVSPNKIVPYGDSGQQSQSANTSHQQPQSDQDDYMEFQIKHQNEQKRKREREAVKRHIAQQQFSKLAKENPDLLNEKNLEMMLKYDVKTMDKSTKILPPMLNNPKLKVNTAIKQKNNTFDNSTSQLNNNSVIEKQEVQEQGVVDKDARAQELEELLNELDQEVGSPQLLHINNNTFLKSKTGANQFSPDKYQLQNGLNFHHKKGSAGAQDFDININSTELWSHQNSNGQTNLKASKHVDRNDPLRNNDIESLELGYNQSLTKYGSQVMMRGQSGGSNDIESRGKSGANRDRLKPEEKNIIYNESDEDDLLNF